MSRARNVYKHCVPRRWLADQYPFADDPVKGLTETWCGGKGRLWDRDKPFEAPKLATCIKCAQAIGKAGLAKHRARLRLEPREQPLGYDKSTYDVFIDDVLRAHVGIANGWGEKWYLAKVGDPDEARHWTNGRHGGRVSGSVIDYFEANAWLNGSHNAPESIIFWPVHYTARDAMACAALAYWDKYGVQGLPTVEEAKAAKEAKREADAQEAKEREARRIEREKERDLEDKARAERRTTWGAALAELEARGDLTNLERAGLEAIKALYPMG